LFVSLFKSTQGLLDEPKLGEGIDEKEEGCMLLDLSILLTASPLPSLARASFEWLMDFLLAALYVASSTNTSLSF
jgi:hypothetical protein